MARITVEDCLKHSKNRFDLVLKAAKRARDLDKGVEALVDRKNEKSTIVALREIAAGLLAKAQAAETSETKELSQELTD